MTRAIGRILGLLLIASGGGFAWLIYGQSFERTELPRVSTADELRHAGWYEDDAGAAFLLTPSANGGLFRLDLPGSARRSYPDHLADLTIRPMAAPPYTVQQVSYESDVVLSGTLMIPVGAVRAGAVMIHGSGASDRDNGWYMMIADHLARNGVAVLLPDKRGTGQSGGVWQTASFEDFSNDARAGLAALRGTIDAPRLGYVGISQGGWIAPLAAQDGVAEFAAAVSSALVPPLDQLAHETRATLRQDGVPDWLIPVAFPIAYHIPQWQRAVWWRKNGRFDQVSVWQAGTVPGFIAIGTADNDDNMPLAETIEAFTVLEAVRGDDVRLVLYEGSGHALYAPDTTSIRDDFLDDLTDFVLGTP